MSKRDKSTVQAGDYIRWVDTKVHPGWAQVLRRVRVLGVDGYVKPDLEAWVMEHPDSGFVFENHKLWRRDATDYNNTHNWIGNCWASQEWWDWAEPPPSPEWGEEGY